MKTFEEQLRETLREQEQGLDAATLTRIGAARRSALAAAPRAWLRFLTPAIGGAVLASAIGVAVLLPGTAPQQPASSTNGELVENPELYRDLEFYLWLAESDMGKHG